MTRWFGGKIVDVRQNIYWWVERTDVDVSAALAHKFGTAKIVRLQNTLCTTNKNLGKLELQCSHPHLSSL